MEHLIRRAVETIYKRHGEPLSLDELAQHAMVSKFHFLRMFSRVTGVTPGRFLSAVRLQEAKRLLLTTSFNVANISAEVGYSSTGTFTRRFTRSVGVSPTEYRRLYQGDWTVPEGRNLSGAPSCGATQHVGTVAGHALAEGDLRSKFYVGLFESAILQGPAVAWEIIDGQGAFVLPGVPAGTWYLHAVAYGTHGDAAPSRLADLPMLWDAVGPITVSAESTTQVELRARALDWSRPPILLALPGLDPVVTAA